MNPRIDLNCDLGEGFGVYSLGDDAAIMPYVSSINIAAGFHAGDPSTIRETLELASKYKINIGAHPGFPDLVGFGRRNMSMSPQEVYDTVLYQIGAVFGFTRAAGMDLIHVKPHGALYNMAAKDRLLADAIALAVHRFDWNLILVGLAGSEIIHAGQAIGLRTASEGFLDRNYEADASLTPRSNPQAVLHDLEIVTARAVRWIRDGVVTARTGERLTLRVDTLCIHGDSPNAARLCGRVRELLASQSIEVEPLKR
jgi:5-oxoprolinase (ATP-hydrolysing) subunit A